MSEPDSLEVLEQIKNVPCPICGAIAWATFGPLGNLLVGLPAKTPTGDPVTTAEEWGSLDAFAFTCNRCGFVRLHATQVLTRVSQALPDDAD